MKNEALETHEHILVSFQDNGVAFDEEELLCKIRVILRHTAGAPQKEQPTQFCIGRYFFDYNLHELQFNGNARRKKT